MFPMIGVREPDSDGLVNEEYVCIFVPRVRVESDVVGVVDSAGTYGNVNIPMKHKVKIYFFVPSSMNSPVDEEHPGPPFVQKITSSLSGLLLLSKK